MRLLLPGSPRGSRRRFTGALTALAALPWVGAAATARAQGTDSSGRTLHVVVPFSAGGVQDMVARSLITELSQGLGQPGIVENRVGAGGTIGTGIVAKSPPDGNTLILAAASHSINGTLYKKLSYDPVKDFVGAAMIGNSSYVLVLNSEVPARSVAELITLARSKPGTLNYASAGNGSASHLSMAYFNSMAGINAVHVPTKSTGEAMTEVLAGRCQMLISANVGAMPYVNDNRVRLLGVTSTRPSRFLPGIAPIAAVVPGYEFDSWIGLLAPVGTPRPVLERINGQVQAMLKQPEIQERLSRQGIEPVNLSIDEFAGLLRSDFDKMAKVVKSSGATID